MKAKRILSLVLAVFLVVGMMAFPTAADSITYTPAGYYTDVAIEADTSWYSDGGTTFTITTAEQFLGFATLSQAGKTFAGKTVLLGADIDLNPVWSAKTQGKAQITDGTTVKIPVTPTNVFPGFKNWAGTLNGQGHTVSGIYMSKTNISSAYGLFCELLSGSSLQNIGFVNSFIYCTTSSSMGNIGISTLVGRVYTETYTPNDILIDGVYVGAELVLVQNAAGKGMLGGFIGRHEKTAAANTAAKEAETFASVVNINDSAFGGKLIDVDSTMTIGAKKVLNLSQAVGGGGHIDNKGDFTCLTNCALLGENYGLNSKSTSENWGEGQVTFINLIYGTSAETETLSSANYRATSWYDSSTHTPLVQYDSSLATYSNVAFSYPLASLAPRKVAEMIGTYAYPDISWYNESSVYEISNLNQWHGLSVLNARTSNRPTYYGKTIKLTADIDLNPGWNGKADYNTDSNVVTVNTPAFRFEPFVWFYGTFDGQGHSVKGFYTDITGWDDHWAFIRLMTGGSVVKNFALYGVNYVKNPPSKNVGGKGISGLIGAFNYANAGTLYIQNVYVDVDIVVERNTSYTQNYMVGGIVGRQTNTASTSYAKIDSTVFAGRIFTIDSTAKTPTVGVLNTAQLSAGSIADGTPAVKRTTFTNCVAIGSIYSTTSGSSGSSPETYGEGKTEFVNVVHSKVSDSTVAINGQIMSGTQNGTRGSFYPYTTKDIEIADFSYSFVLGAFVPTTIANMIATGIVPDTAWYDGHESDTSFEIGTAAELLGLSNIVNRGEHFINKTIIITEDIDLNPDWNGAKVTVNGSDAVTVPTVPADLVQFAALINFRGTIDGQWHAIKGLYADNFKGDYCGLLIRYLATTSTAADTTIGVKNLSVEKSYLHVGPITAGNPGIGGLIGGMEANADRFIAIENVYVDCDILYESAGNNNGILGGIAGRITAVSAPKLVDDKTVYGVSFDSVAFGGNIVCVGKAAKTPATGIILDNSQFLGGGQKSGSVDYVCAVNCAMIGSLTSARNENYAEGKIKFLDLLEGSPAYQATMVERKAALIANIKLSTYSATSGEETPNAEAVDENPGFVYSNYFAKYVPAGIAQMKNNNVFVQQTDPDATTHKFDIRILSAIESLEWNEVGFLVTVKVNGTVYYDNQAYKTTSVYQSVKAAGKYVSASDLQGCEHCDYLYALVITNLPGATGKTVEVIVTPTKISPNGEILNSMPSSSFVFKNGTLKK